MRPVNPRARKWIRIHMEEEGIQLPIFQMCCVYGCKCKKTIRNGSCLQGNWMFKPNHPHGKICIYHYNSDLRQYPRNIFPSKGRRRFKVIRDPNYQPTAPISTFDTSCIIMNCTRPSSKFNVASLKNKWEYKKTHPHRFICNNHYIIDKRYNRELPLKKRFGYYKKNTLS